MPGLVPGNHVFNLTLQQDVDGRAKVSEATPFFERLRPAITSSGGNHGIA
jgi:hypothetical protein